MALTELMAEYAARVEHALAQRLPAPEREPQRLHRAMRYAALDGGKRVRPLLVYLSGQATGAPLERLDVPACAVECIHAYSLVHDDLPAMDDDDLRRGKPTCHRAFDEATAILAGDALQALAFDVLASATELDLPAARRLEMVSTLAGAAGVAGMVGGQALDIDATGKAAELAAMERMHRLKTGALIGASVRLGALCADAPEPAHLAALQRYGAAVGLAFQIRDDILDVEADTATLGKPQGSDAAADKSTYTALLGLHGAKRKLADAHAEAVAALSPFGEAAGPLRELASFIAERAY